MNDINELNYQIYSKLKIKLKVKIGIALKNIEKKEYFAKLERSVATAGDIIVSTKLYNLTSDKFDYATVGPVTIDKAIMTFYKLVQAEYLKSRSFV